MTTTDDYTELADTLTELLDAFPRLADDETQCIFVALIGAVIRQISARVEVAFPKDTMVARLETLLERVADVQRACGVGSMKN